jgi:hypothetical protein
LEDDEARAYASENANDVHGDYENGAVIGRNAVRELLRSDRSVDKLMVQRGERTGSIVVLVAEAIERGIPVVEVDKSKLDALSSYAPHQGVIALAAEKEYCSVEDILEIARERGEAPLIVICDGITDPYNLGAIIRCAECCGAHGLIIPKRRAVGLTPLVTKASAGAVEHLAEGGRIAIISFHSLEDRCVKSTYQKHAQGCTCPPDFPVCICGNKPKIKIITKKPLLPSKEELEVNHRSHSAKLRVAEKV